VKAHPDNKSSRAQRELRTSRWFFTRLTARSRRRNVDSIKRTSESRKPKG